ncbi:MAG: nuclear transport factor 2 family protein [Gemmatimonadota bacterium]|nr:nuclear transport factor 2 family protein [Gemmatimonadota bacterium]
MMRAAAGFVAAWSLAALLGAAPASGQEAGDGRAAPDADREAAVVAVIDGLFDAMRSADADGVHAAFHPELRRLASVGERDGAPAVGYGDLEAFAASVGNAAPGDLDERTGPPEIRFDDDLATVHVPYTFYYQGQVRHCGMNVFHLAPTPEGWKIVGLVDTRRTGACQERSR